MICDVAKYQGKIDWSKFSKNLDFVFIKASGKYANGGDPNYEDNVAGAIKYGVPFHAYHYLYCLTEEEAKRDAGLFYSKVKNGGYKPISWVLDCEAGWGIKDSEAKHIAEVFEKELRRLASEDIRVGLYIAHQKYDVWKFDYEHYDFIWIPRYGDNDGTLEHSKKPAHPCDLWQYTSKGEADGIDPEVLKVNGLDVNVLTGTKPLSFFTGTNYSYAKNEEMKEIGFTGSGLARFCTEVYNSSNWVYWYGTYGNQCSESLYNSKKKQYPDHYTAARAFGYQKDIQNGRWCADCVGLIKAYFWKNGDINATPKYGTNNCPDKSANGMIEYCGETGPISTIPDEPGIVVWKSGHIGVYVGDGYTIEMKGFDYDCKKVKLSSGPWTRWGRLPKSMISYTGEAVKPVEPAAPVDTILAKKGDKGSTVKEMQKLLLKWKPTCLPKYGADGDFGSETELALKQFQKSAGLTATGVYNEDTKKALENQNVSQEPIQTTPQDRVKYVEVTGNYVNVRTGPGTSSTIIGVVRKGDQYKYLDKISVYGWYNIEYNGSSAWISGKYSTVVKG